MHRSLSVFMILLFAWTLSAPACAFATEQEHQSLAHGIPDFCVNPDKVTGASGNWSNPAIWSPRGVPVDAETVEITPGTVVTYDVASDARLKVLCIEGGAQLKFRTDISTRLVVGTLQVMPGGDLEIGTPEVPVASDVTAEVVFADDPLDPMHDPKQFGGGLLGLGKVTVCGKPLTETFLPLARQPLAGESTLLVNGDPAAAGWVSGGEVLIPGTEALPGTREEPQDEVRTIASIHGLEIRLTEPLRFSHRIFTDGHPFDGHVGYLTRNVIFRSENPEGTRGHILFTGHADPDIRYARIEDCGRTTSDPIDNSVVNQNGEVTHVGTNQLGRYAIHAHHLRGHRREPLDLPLTLQLLVDEARVSQSLEDYKKVLEEVDRLGLYTGRFIGLAVLHSKRVGMTIHRTAFLEAARNVIYDPDGACIFLEDGPEAAFVHHNLLVDPGGTGANDPASRESKDSQVKDRGFEGTGLWSNATDANNILSVIGENVVYGAKRGGYLFVRLQPFGPTEMPLWPGADPAIPGESIAMPDERVGGINFGFFDNVAINSKKGLVFWGTTSFDNRYWVKGLESYNNPQAVEIGNYAAGRHTLIDCRLVLDPAISLASSKETAGVTASRLADLWFFNPVITGWAIGIETFQSDFYVEGGIFRNLINIRMEAPVGNHPHGVRRATLRGVTSEALSGYPEKAMEMVFHLPDRNAFLERLGNGNPSDDNDETKYPEDLARVYVYDHQGDPNTDYQLYHPVAQHPDTVVNKWVRLPAAGDTDGNPENNTGRVILGGSPEEGLTNQENSVKYNSDGTLRTDPNAPGLSYCGEIVPLAQVYTDSRFPGSFVRPLASGEDPEDSTSPAPVAPPPVNLAPGVSAGPDQTITLPSSAALTGTVTDDGLPNPPGQVTVTWSVVSGPGTVTFGNPNAAATTATFSMPGTYLLRLTASDGVLSSSADTRVTVNPELPPPPPPPQPAPPPPPSPEPPSPPPAPEPPSPPPSPEPPSPPPSPVPPPPSPPAVGNHPPVLDPIGDQKVKVGEILKFIVHATDPDGDPLRFRFNGLPSGAVVTVVDPLTRTVTWTPKEKQAGAVHLVECVVSENRKPAETDRETFTITVKCGQGDKNR